MDISQTTMQCWTPILICHIQSKYYLMWTKFIEITIEINDLNTWIIPESKRYTNVFWFYILQNYMYFKSMCQFSLVLVVILSHLQIFTLSKLMHCSLSYMTENNFHFLCNDIPVLTIYIPEGEKLYACRKLHYDKESSNYQESLSKSIWICRRWVDFASLESGLKGWLQNCICLKMHFKIINSNRTFFTKSE